MDINSYIKEGILRILVKPNSAKNEIVKWDPNKKALRVNIDAVPDKNKANKEVIKFFSKLLGKKAEIIKGMKSREKIISFS